MSPRVILARACLLLLGSVVALAVGELTVRAASRVLCFGRDNPPYVAHDVIGWVHEPGGEGRAFRCVGGLYEFHQRVRFNEDGYRGPPHRRDREAGVSRVLVLGDSITEGLQVAVEDTFAQQLQASVTELGGPTEVINAGVAAYGTDNALLYFQERGVDYQPDLVVLVFNLANDIAENHPDLHRMAYYSGGRPPPAKAAARLMPSGAVIFDTAWLDRQAERIARGELDRNLARPNAWRRGEQWSELARAIGHLGRPFVRSWVHANQSESVVDEAAEPGSLRPLLLARRARESPYPVRYGVYHDPPTADWEEAWRITEALIDRLRRAAFISGARLLVVVVPHKILIDPRSWEAAQRKHPVLATEAWNLEYPRARLTGFLEAQQMVHVDLTDALREAEQVGGGPVFFDVDVHLSEAGHRVVSRKLTPVVARLLALESRRRRPMGG